MLEINSEITIKSSELRFDFVRSSGPGGQNVNKVSYAVQLRFDLRNSTSLPEEITPRLIELAGKRVNSDGILVLDARTSRSQSQNREEALERLRSLILKSLYRPKPRRKTMPTSASKEKRLRNKKARGNVKRLRGKVKDDD